MEEGTERMEARRVASSREGTARPHQRIGDKSPWQNPNDTYKLNARIQRGKPGAWRGEGEYPAGPRVEAVSQTGLSTPGRGRPHAAAPAPAPVPGDGRPPPARAGRRGGTARHGSARLSSAQLYAAAEPPLRGAAPPGYLGQ